MAVVADPGQAAIGMWQPGLHRGFGVYDEPDTPGWFELHTRDYEKVVDFYRTAFGCDTHVMSDAPEFRYSTLNEGEDQDAGIMDAAAFLPDGVPAHWAVYFHVESTDAAVARWSSSAARRAGRGGHSLRPHRQGGGHHGRHLPTRRERRRVRPHRSGTHSSRVLLAAGRCDHRPRGRSGGHRRARHVTKRSELPLAFVPIVLATHSFIEAFVWWGLEGKVAFGVGRFAVWAYLVIAFCLLPVLAPSAVALIAPTRRRTLALGFITLGIGVAAALTLALLHGPVMARTASHHVAYSIDLHYGGVIVALYVVAVCGPMLASPYPRVRWFGMANLVAVRAARVARSERPDLAVVPVGGGHERGDRDAPRGAGSPVPTGPSAGALKRRDGSGLGLHLEDADARDGRGLAHLLTDLQRRGARFGLLLGLDEHHGDAGREVEGAGPRAAHEAGLTTHERDDVLPQLLDGFLGLTGVPMPH